MNALLELFNFGAEDYASNLSDGVLVFLIGMATVFAVLTIILAILSLFGVFFGKSSACKAKAAPAPVISAPVAPVAAGSDDEIVAVIAAAIAAAESESAGVKYRVVSFNRK